MTPLILQDGKSRAAIAVEFGFNCYEFQAAVGGRVINVLDTLPDLLAGSRRPTHSGSPILFPFPNRIRHGRFEWQGGEYSAPIIPPRPDAIHGYALDTAWRVIDQGPSHAVGQWQLSVDAPDRISNWPADCLIEVRYELQGPALRSQFRIVNPDTRPLPWGLGMHTYFKLPLCPEGRLEDCLIDAPAHKLWVLDNSLPTGQVIDVPADRDIRRSRPVGGDPRDDVYTDLRCDAAHDFRGAATHGFDCAMRDPAAGLEVVQSCGRLFRELVVFTPPNRNAFCMEPYTCATNAINLQPHGIDAGLQVLRPGEEVSTWIDLKVGEF